MNASKAKKNVRNAAIAATALLAMGGCSVLTVSQVMDWSSNKDESSYSRPTDNTADNDTNKGTTEDKGTQAGKGTANEGIYNDKGTANDGTTPSPQSLPDADASDNLADTPDENGSVEAPSGEKNNEAYKNLTDSFNVRGLDTSKPKKDGNYVSYEVRKGRTEDGREVAIMTPKESIRKKGNNSVTKPVRGGSSLVIDENGNVVKNPVAPQPGPVPHKPKPGETPVKPTPEDKPAIILVEYFDEDAFNAATAEWQDLMDTVTEADNKALATLDEKQGVYDDAKVVSDKANEDYNQAKSELDALVSRLDLAAPERVSQLEQKVRDLRKAKEDAQSDLDVAKEILENAKFNEEAAKANVIPAQQDLDNARARHAEAKEALDNYKGIPEEDMLLLMADAMGERINEYRALNGLHPLVFEVNLNKKAATYSARMAETGSFKHSTPQEFGWYSENILSNATICSNSTRTRGECSDAMVDQWIKSDGHNANLLSERATHAGIGLAVNERGRVYATHMSFTDNVRSVKGGTYGRSAGLEDMTTDGYLPEGAIGLLGDNHYTLVKDDREITNYAPYEGGKDAVDRSKGAREGLSPELADLEAAPDKATLEKNLSDAEGAVRTAERNLEARQGTADKAAKEVRESEGAVTEAEKVVEDTDNQIESTTKDLNQAREDMKNTESVKKEIAEKTPEVEDLKSKADAASEDTSKAKGERDEAKKAADEATKVKKDTEAKKPKKEDFTEKVTPEEKAKREAAKHPKPEPAPETDESAVESEAPKDTPKAGEVPAPKADEAPAPKADEAPAPKADEVRSKVADSAPAEKESPVEVTTPEEM